MKKSKVFLLITILAALCIPLYACAQSVTPSIGDFLMKVDTLATVAAGLATTIITQIFTNWQGTSKTNALITAICIAAGIGGALILLGIPSFGITSIFTIASSLFAIYRKLSKAWAG